MTALFMLLGAIIFFGVFGIGIVAIFNYFQKGKKHESK